MEGNLRFKIDWASLYWQGNLPFLLCFTLCSRANSKYKPLGGGRAYIRRGDLTEGFLLYYFGGLYLEGLIFGILRYLGKFMTKSIKLNLYSEFNLTIIDPCKILERSRINQFSSSHVSLPACDSLSHGMIWLNQLNPGCQFSVIKHLVLIA